MLTCTRTWWRSAAFLWKVAWQPRIASKRIDRGTSDAARPYAPRSRSPILFDGTSRRRVFARVAPRVEHAPPTIPHEVLHVLRVVEPVLLVALEALEVGRDLVLE